ncbi:LAETG motif-containing sortase-dependent surface protein [Streptomyces sp. CRN 30]|uniref:LAETG motif-containing sortase-dependent surface protein n=1 Tax=Streptomyces sp. CRN 30 TaxID=3075613 RepID=UPI002A83235E|nr:LAETG motif-containing sortase-dependent surface protein [Streptomyces sp. CRN 30]
MRFLGVVSASAALVLGVAGNAMACSIRDFSAVAECDAAGKGVISVTDVDPSGVTAEVTVYLENNGADERLVGTQTIENATAAGVTVTFSEDWQPNAEYRIHVKAEGYVDEDIKPNLTTPAEACASSDEQPPAEEPEQPEQPSDEPSPETSAPAEDPAPSASGSTAPAAPGDDVETPQGANAPAPAGQSNLAETGAGSNTPVIVGIAAAFVVAGGGAVYFGMRRRGASSR